MSRIIRSAMLQMRVTPAVKHASEKIFHRMGLSMTEAVELFLRRAILDERLPFEVVALNDARLVKIAEDHERQLTVMKMSEKKGGPAKKRIQNLF